MKKLCFDFDGTLLDSRLRHKVVLQNALLSLDNSITEIDLDDYIDYKSNGNNTWQYLTNRHNYPLEKAKAISNIWSERIENQEYLCTDILYTDTVATITELANEYDLILLSARKNEKFLIQQLKNLSIFDYFLKIECVNPYNAKIEKQNILKRESDVVLSIGDTEIDFEAAKFNSVSFYPLNRGFRNKQYWDSLNIQSFSDFSGISPFLLERSAYGN